MGSIFSIIGTPLGWVMHFIYQFVQNYGISLLLFTILMRVLMIPLSLNQQKGLVANARMRPKMEEIQKKYANNREMMNKEMMELYQKENYSPLSSCLPLFIQLPIMFGLIDVVYYPLKHVLRLPEDIIASATTIAQTVLGEDGMNRYSAEMSILSAVEQNPSAFSSLGSDVVASIQNFDFTFLGLNLGDVPSILPGDMDFGLYLVLLLVPLLSGASSFMLSMISMRSTKAINGNSPANGSMNMMMYTMPLFSMFFTFQVPIGVGMYWVMSNLIMSGQSLVLNKIMNPAKIVAEAQAKAREEAEKERQDRIEAKRLAKERGEVPEKALSQKEINRQRLAAARKRDAEKYGDTYKEVDDGETEQE